ncbi:MAG: tRNA-uridine aminocarboxypropyltransferase [Thiopseudomonas sp.]
MPHAVARLRTLRLARSQKPFAARGALLGRCPRCRVAERYCICSWQPQVQAHSGVCLVMADKEPLKPSNTGWLIADVVPDTNAFLWDRTEPDAGLLALLADPQWQPWLVFPADEAVSGQPVAHELPASAAAGGRRPLFVLLDGTWQEARKMYRKSPYLQQLPVLSLRPAQLSRYHLRTALSPEQLSTAEVTMHCLHQAGDDEAATALAQWFARFNRHYLAAKRPPGKAREQHLLAH